MPHTRVVSTSHPQASPSFAHAPIGDDGYVLDFDIHTAPKDDILAFFNTYGFVVIKNVTFLVKMIKKFVFFYILMQWLSYHENPAARLRGIHVGPRQGPEPPANHP